MSKRMKNLATCLDPAAALELRALLAVARAARGFIATTGPDHPWFDIVATIDALRDAVTRLDRARGDE